jgi:hypothetical protein
MTIAPDALAVSWGYRRQLIPKSLAYVYSLDFVALAEAGGRWYLRTNDIPTECGESYHVFSETAVPVGLGVRFDVPVGTVQQVYGEVLDASSVDPDDLGSSLDTAGFSARVVLATDSGLIVATLDGVVNVNGGTSNIQRSVRRRAESDPSRPLPRLSGTSVVSLTHEAGRSRYRWMDRCQLFGVGRVQEQTHLDDGLLRLGFSFDVYFAR